MLYSKCSDLNNEERHLIDENAAELTSRLQLILMLHKLNEHETHHEVDPSD